MRAGARIATAVLLGVALVATPAAAHDDEQPKANSYVLEGDLVPEGAVPGPGPQFAGAFPILTIVPEEGSLCYDIWWDQIDRLTGFVIRLGPPEEFEEAIEVDFETSPPDEMETESTGGFANGCIESEPNLLDFIAHEPGFSHLTVYSGDHPQGAAGGSLFLRNAPGFEAEEHEQDEPDTVVTFVLVSNLTPEHVAPSAPDVAGSGEARLEVIPDFDQVCWDVGWTLDEPVTESHLHVGGPGEVDAEEFRLGLIKEAHEFGGTVSSDSAEACVSVTHVVDFFGLVEDPGSHYVDVHTEDHPDGALRGQLVLEDEFDTAVDDHDHDEEESGRGVVDYVPHLLVLLSLLGAAGVAVVTLRRSRGLYERPPSAVIVATAVSASMLAIAALLMLFDLAFAPVSGICEDLDRYTALGLALAGIGVLVGAGTAILARHHPPLRRIALAIAIASALTALAWVLWVAPEGCGYLEGDVEPAGPLDCVDRVFIHGDPDPSFEGYATPEEAVAASAVGSLGRAKEDEGSDWLIEMDGRIVGRVTVDTWGDDRYVVFDTEVCSDVEPLLGY